MISYHDDEFDKSIFYKSVGPIVDLHEDVLVYRNDNSPRDIVGSIPANLYYSNQLVARKLIKDQIKSDEIKLTRSKYFKNKNVPSFARPKTPEPIDKPLLHHYLPPIHTHDSLHKKRDLRLSDFMHRINNKKPEPIKFVDLLQTSNYYQLSKETESRFHVPIIDYTRELTIAETRLRKPIVDNDSVEIEKDYIAEIELKLSRYNEYHKELYENNETKYFTSENQKIADHIIESSNNNTGRC